MFKLRDFRETDISAIQEIVLHSLREIYDPNLYRTIANNWRNGFIVAEHNCEVIGFIAGTIDSPEETRVLMFAVKENYRDRGIGTILFTEYIRRSAMLGAKRISLEVRVSNRRAIDFYTRFSFVIVGVLPLYYSDGEDGYKMVKIL
ncbi:MAG: GNAT family N-acetyltransferase [Thermoplasmata archaeon]